VIKNIFSKNNKKVLLLAGIFVIGLAVFIFVGINNASAVGLCSSCSDTITCDSTLNCSYLGSSYGYGCINANCSYKTTAYCKASSVSSCLGYSIATPPYSDVQVCTLSNGSPVIADDFIGYHYHSFSCNDFYSSSDCYDDWVPYSGCTSGGFWWKVTISAVSVVPPSGTAWDCWSTCSNDSCMGTKLVASLGECPCISTCPFSSAYCSTDPPPYDTGCDKYCPVGTKNDCPSSST